MIKQTLTFASGLTAAAAIGARVLASDDVEGYGGIFGAEMDESPELEVQSSMLSSSLVFDDDFGTVPTSSTIQFILELDEPTTALSVINDGGVSAVSELDTVSTERVFEVVEDVLETFKEEPVAKAISNYSLPPSDEEKVLRWICDRSSSMGAVSSWFCTEGDDSEDPGAEKTLYSVPGGTDGVVFLQSGDVEYMEIDCFKDQDGNYQCSQDEVNFKLWSTLNGARNQLSK